MLAKSVNVVARQCKGIVLKTVSGIAHGRPTYVLWRVLCIYAAWGSLFMVHVNLSHLILQLFVRFVGYFASRRCLPVAACAASGGTNLECAFWAVEFGNSAFWWCLHWGHQPNAEVRFRTHSVFLHCCWCTRLWNNYEGFVVGHTALSK